MEVRSLSFCLKSWSYNQLCSMKPQLPILTRGIITPILLHSCKDTQD